MATTDVEFASRRHHSLGKNLAAKKMIGSFVGMPRIPCAGSGALHLERPDQAFESWMHLTQRLFGVLHAANSSPSLYPRSTRDIASTRYAETVQRRT